MNLRLTTYGLFIAPLLVAFSCIKPYDPDIGNDGATKYVIAGRVTDTEGIQELKVSLSSPSEEPQYIPVSGCTAYLQDDHGNSFLMEEYEAGTYYAWMDKEYLQVGTSYRVNVITPDGQELLSAFDPMRSCPPLDSVYYEISSLPTLDPTVYKQIVQFYIDLIGEGYTSQHYKWEVEETWEYHVPHAKEYYYNGYFNKIDPPDSSEMVCWISGLFPKVFTLSTTSLTSNNYRRMPLHSFDGSTSRLSVLYSILIRQMALSEDAYNYWEQLRINSSQEGGLYEKQPLAIKGNVQNITNPEQTVLGFFYAASESTWRYFYKEMEGLELNFYNYCQEEGLGRMGWREFRPSDYPVYYYYTDGGGLLILNKECVNCTLRGGTTTKPYFWP